VEMGAKEIVDNNGKNDMTFNGKLLKTGDLAKYNACKDP